MALTMVMTLESNKLSKKCPWFDYVENGGIRLSHQV